MPLPAPTPPHRMRGAAALLAAGLTALTTGCANPPAAPDPVADAAQVPPNPAAAAIAPVPGQLAEELDAETATGIYNRLQAALREGDPAAGLLADRAFLEATAARFDVPGPAELAPILDTASRSVGAYELHDPHLTGLRPTAGGVTMDAGYTLLDSTDPTDQRRGECSRSYRLARLPLGEGSDAPAWKIVALDRDGCEPARYLLVP